MDVVVVVVEVVVVVVDRESVVGFDYDWVCWVGWFDMKFVARDLRNEVG